MTELCSKLQIKKLLLDVCKKKSLKCYKQKNEEKKTEGIIKISEISSYHFYFFFSFFIKFTNDNVYCID